MAGQSAEISVTIRPRPRLRTKAAGSSFMPTGADPAMTARNDDMPAAIARPISTPSAEPIAASSRASIITLVRTWRRVSAIARSTPKARVRSATPIAKVL